MASFQSLFNQMNTISINKYFRIKELIHKYDFKMVFTPLLDTL